MPKIDIKEDEELGVLEDKTEALTLNSKRMERVRKKQTRKAMKAKNSPQGFLSVLPYELVMEILTLLRPSDIFRLQRTSKPLHDFIVCEEARIARAVSGWRYSCLERCFRLPVLLANIDPAIHRLLQTPERQEILTIHKKPYQHIKPPEPTEVCTCLTCMLRWSALAIIVDFAHWQEHLDKGEPIPMIPRGKFPEWNQLIIAAHAVIVRKALYSPLWHARLLEVHLDTITRSIQRHAANKGNKRRRFRMTEDDVNSGTDVFLTGAGRHQLTSHTIETTTIYLRASCRIVAGARTLTDGSMCPPNNMIGILSLSFYGRGVEGELRNRLKTKRENRLQLSRYRFEV